MGAEMSDVSSWIGLTAVGPDGDKVGKINDVYADDDTGRPEWLAVTTGMFGTRVSFVPLAGAAPSGGEIRVAYPKDQVKGAPQVEADGQLSPQEEDRLYEYYGRGAAQAGSGLVDTGGGSRTAEGYDTSGPTTDDAMTRSEEELTVGTREREAGRARLRKWVETERVEQTVPVQREVARVVTEPITEDNVGRATAGPELSGEEHEVVLHEEEVDVTKRVVPKERVRLEVETVTEQVPVSEEVRKEHIELDQDGQVRRREERQR
jgi:uncharacterized protein (TIGR02271 family)